MSNISLDGAEITILKTLGLGGSSMAGKDFKTRVPGMNPKELLDVVQPLIELGFITCNCDLNHVEDFDKASLAVNPGYSKELKEVIDPEPKERNKRQRRV